MIDYLRMLDEAIAKKMWETVWIGNELCRVVHYERDDGTEGIKHEEVPFYSTRDMLKLDREMADEGFIKAVRLQPNGYGCVEYFKASDSHITQYGSAGGNRPQETLSALAAYKAFYGVEWEGREAKP